MAPPAGKYWSAMRTPALLVAIALLAAMAAGEDGAPPNGADRYWGQWRGPLSTGVAPHGNPPVEWSDRENIRWKTRLPGSGHSTPIVWGDRVFVTTAVPYGQAVRHEPVHGEHDNRSASRPQRFVVLAINRRDGKIVWQQAVHKELPHEGGHVSSTFASPSPVTDGKYVFAYFGSWGLYCLDLAGRTVWSKDLGQMRIKHAHGEGGSPVLFGETLVVNWDHAGQSFIVAFDKRTGKQRWKTLRDEVTSWATPIVVTVDKKPQVIVSGTGRLRGYDLATGKVVWQCAGLSHNIVASPVASDTMVFAGSSYEIRTMLAVHLGGAKGDITDTRHIAWTRRYGTPYVPSPLLYGNALYFLRHYQPVLSRVSAKTGEDLGGPVRLPALRNIYASPVGAAGRVYITDRNGTTLVIGHDAELKVLARNSLNDSISASAAIAGREIFLRGQNHLYCIAESPPAKSSQ